MSKASAGYGTPAELFQILKDDAVKVLHSICQKIWKTQQWPQDWKIYFNPKERQCQEFSNYSTVALILHASKIMLKIFQSRLQQCIYLEISDVQTGFSKSRGTRDQIANIYWIIKKAREFQRNIYFCFIKYTKMFDCENHNKLWEILKEMGIQTTLPLF